MVRYRRSIAAVSFAFFLLHCSIPARQLYAQGKSGVVWQSPRQLTEGLAYLEKRQYTPALNLLEPLANQGVPAAQAALAEMYEKGLGVQRNFITAETWYGRAIAQGNTAAEEKRATMRERIERRFQEGIEAFRVEDYARARERWCCMPTASECHVTRRPRAGGTSGPLRRNIFRLRIT
jgi:hypothetical protein